MSVVTRFDNFPVPLDAVKDCLDGEYQRFFIHRPIDMEHGDACACACCPIELSADEVTRITCDQLNDLMVSAIQ